MRLLRPFRPEGRSPGEAANRAGDTVLSPPSDEPSGPPSAAERLLGDFTIRPDVWLVLALSLAAGMLSAGVALGLLDLIGLITHLLYYGRVAVGLVQPTVHRLGAVSLVIPVGGGLAIGAMAYWGSERIRGHGIPEAMETILVGGSKVEPRLAILKPVSSAISIGTGGPFGAEGPIILTGGAFGSVVAQFFHLSASQRRTLLVAGACAGMAAVFGTPVAATLFGIELLVFEWKPRSLVPIAVAVAVASVIRNIMAAHGLILAAPLFPVPPHGTFSAESVAAAAAVGVACGLLAWVLTGAVYGAEDLFKKLPVHWAWWPAIGGVVIGAGGLADPRALGVGYASIHAVLAGRIAFGGLVALLVVKLVIWSAGLGSGTSGGILAPLLMMGAALGGIMAPVLPGGTPGTWALLGLAGALAGVTRSPFTAIVFAFELTRDTGSLLPLLVTCSIAHLISSLVLKRSILTEKVARRGFHVVREYQVDPLEALFVREAMQQRDDVITVTASEPAARLAGLLDGGQQARRQRLVPVLDGGTLAGVVTPSGLARHGLAGRGLAAMRAADVAHADVVVAYPDETLRSAADRMAQHWLGALPVVSRADRRLLGILTEFNLLKARQRQFQEERLRERVLRFGRPGSVPDGPPPARPAGPPESRPSSPPDGPPVSLPAGPPGGAGPGAADGNPRGLHNRRVPGQADS